MCADCFVLTLIAHLMLMATTVAGRVAAIAADGDGGASASLVGAVVAADVGGGGC